MEAPRRQSERNQQLASRRYVEEQEDLEADPVSQQDIGDKHTRLPARSRSQQQIRNSRHDHSPLRSLPRPATGFTRYASCTEGQITYRSRPAALNLEISQASQTPRMLLPHDNAASLG